MTCLALTLLIVLIFKLSPGVTVITVTIFIAGGDLLFKSSAAFLHRSELQVWKFRRNKLLLFLG